MAGEGIGWQEWHHEWATFTAEQKRRDQEHLDALLEVRDMMGVLHIRFDSLPCDENKRQLAHLSIDVAALQQRGVLARAVTNAIQPIIRPRLLVGAMGIMAAVLGWDWWGRIDAAIQRLLK